MSDVHTRPDLDPNFSFRVDTDGDLLADEPSTINDVVAKEDWYRVSRVE